MSDSEDEYERTLKHRCSECSKPVEGKFIKTIEGFNICNVCKKDRCHNCHTVFVDKAFIETYEGFKFCTGCMGCLNRCDKCKEWFYKDLIYCKRCQEYFCDRDADSRGCFVCRRMA